MSARAFLRLAVDRLASNRSRSVRMSAASFTSASTSLLVGPEPCAIRWSQVRQGVDSVGRWIDRGLDDP